MFWFVIGAISIAAFYFLARPFLAEVDISPSLDEEDYFRAQIGDVARERAAGRLSDEDADIADLEARRRLLAAGRKSADAGRAAPGAANPVLRQAAILVAGAAPVAAMAAYLSMGAPFSQQAGPPPPEIANAAAAPTAAPDMTAIIDRLRGRLAENPADLDGWIALAESYGTIGQFAEAAEAYGRAIELSPDTAYLHAAYGETLVLANQGFAPVEANEAFARALEIDPNEPRARFYQAQALYQRGRREEALSAFVNLLNDAAPGDAWAEAVRRRVRAVAGELGRPIENIGLSEAAYAGMTAPAPGPGAGAAAAAADIAGLEAAIESGDAAYTDWMTLADAYAAQGRMEDADNLLARGEERYAAAPFVLQQIRAARARLASGDGARRGPTQEQIAAAQSLSAEDQQAMIRGMVEGLAARLENEPDDLEGWRMLGRSYGVLGDLDASVAAHARAADLAPDNLEVKIALAEAMLVRANQRGADIDAEIDAVLRDIEARQPENPFALYYLGLSATQRDDDAAAAGYWRRLREIIPEGSQDAARLDAMLEQLDTE